AAGVLILGIAIFFMIPRFTTGYLGALNLQPTLMTGFSDNVTLGEIGRIQKNPSVVMRIAVEGDPNAAQNVHWRGSALTTFDDSGWYTPVREQNVVVANADGEYPLRLGDLSRGTFSPLHYTVLMEPIATDVIFVAARLQSIRGRFGEDSTRPDGVPRSPYL